MVTDTMAYGKNKQTNEQNKISCDPLIAQLLLVPIRATKRFMGKKGRLCVRAGKQFKDAHFLQNLISTEHEWRLNDS